MDNDLPSTCAIKFTAKWCRACQDPSLKHFLEVNTKKHNIKFVEVDIDLNEKLRQQFDVAYIPLIVVLNDNKEIERCGFDKCKIENALMKIKKIENQINLPILQKAKVIHD